MMHQRLHNLSFIKTKEGTRTYSIIEKNLHGSRLTQIIFDSISIVIEKYIRNNDEILFLIKDDLYNNIFLVRDDTEQLENVIKSIFNQINEYVNTRYGKFKKYELNEEEIIFIFQDEIGNSKEDIRIRINKNGLERQYDIRCVVGKNIVIVNLYDIITMIENYIESIYSPN